MGLLAEVLVGTIVVAPLFEFAAAALVGLLIGVADLRWRSRAWMVARGALAMGLGLAIAALSISLFDGLGLDRRLGHVGAGVVTCVASGGIFVAVSAALRGARFDDETRRIIAIHAGVAGFVFGLGLALGRVFGG